MTHPTYTREQLESKKLVELKAIASTLGVQAQDKRSLESHINAIIEAQPQLIAQVDISESASEIQNYTQQLNILSYAWEDGAGNIINYANGDLWLSEKIESQTYIVWEVQKTIQELAQEVVQLTAQAELNAYIEQQAETVITQSDIPDCILEPVGKTENNTQTVYNAKHKGAFVGLIFHIHATNTWQCCDGKDYKYPSEALAGLIELQKIAAARKVAEKIPAYTKAAAKRLINFATKIEEVREMPGCVQVTYLIHGKRSSAFFSKKDFQNDFVQLRIEGAAEIEVAENHDGTYVVKSKDSYYTVNLDHPDPHQRCECGDCHYRGSKCKHQRAVKEYIFQLSKAA